MKVHKYYKKQQKTRKRMTSLCHQLWCASSNTLNTINTSTSCDNISLFPCQTNSDVQSRLVKYYKNPQRRIKPPLHLQPPSFFSFSGPRPPKDKRRLDVPLFHIQSISQASSTPLCHLVALHQTWIKPDLRKENAPCSKS